MERERFVREAESLGIDHDRATSLYERLYTPESIAPAAHERGRLMLGAVWFGVALVVAASAWWASLLDAPSGGALVLLAVWLTGFATAAELTFRRGERLLCGGLATIALGYAVAIVVMAFDLADATPDDVSDPEVIAVSAAFLVLSSLVLARYRRPVVAFAVALAGAALLGSCLDLFLSESLTTLLVGGVAIAIGALVDIAGWRRFAGWVHVVGAALLGEAALDRWEGTATVFVLSLIAAALGLALARIGYLVVAIALLVWVTIDVSPRALVPVISLTVGLGVLACVVLLVRRGNFLEPWLARHDLRRRQRDLHI